MGPDRPRALVDADVEYGAASVNENTPDDLIGAPTTGTNHDGRVTLTDHDYTVTVESHGRTAIHSRTAPTAPSPGHG